MTTAANLSHPRPLTQSKNAPWPRGFVAALVRAR